MHHLREEGNIGMIDEQQEINNKIFEKELNGKFPQGVDTEVVSDKLIVQIWNQTLKTCT